ncbi:MAG: hypothetical protein JSS34_02625 [Proteobacteria bacterium]|nr:hypothetical protein [Pseudomonadota bacterium]
MRHISLNFIFLFIFSFFLVSFDVFSMSEDTLVIGCRPWDDNLKNVALGKAHFIDFMDMGHTRVGDTTFHHIDFNDTNMYSAGKLSEFSLANPKKYTTILIDWSTQHHIRSDAAWGYFYSLLKPEGKLIIAVAPSFNFKTQEVTTEQKAQELLDKLQKQSSFSFEIYPYPNELTSETRDIFPISSLELLGRKYDAVEKMSGEIYPDVYSSCRMQGRVLIGTKQAF